MRRFKVLLLFALGAVLLAACGGVGLSGAGGELEEGPVRGSLAPDFELQTVSGETVRLSDLRGKKVMLNFWATWCAPCRIEMPLIQARRDLYSSELTVLLIDNNESAEVVQAFMEELGLSMDSLLDPQAKIQFLYRVRGYPSSFFIDEEGVIQDIHIGVMAERQLDGYLSQLGIEIASATD